MKPKLFLGLFIVLASVLFMKSYVSVQEVRIPDKMANRNLKNLDSKQDRSYQKSSPQNQPQLKNNFENIRRVFRKINKHKISQQASGIIEKSQKTTVGFENNYSITEDMPAWEKFQLSISNQELYGTDEESQSMINELLASLAVSPFTSISQFEGGTQFKLLVNLQDGGEAMFKPMRFPRSQGTLPNHYQFNDFERHTAEIAAFHLDKLLVSSNFWKIT